MRNKRKGFAKFARQSFPLEKGATLTKHYDLPKNIFDEVYFNKLLSLETADDLYDYCYLLEETFDWDSTQFEYGFWSARYHDLYNGEELTSEEYDELFEIFKSWKEQRDEQEDCTADQSVGTQRNTFSIQPSTTYTLRTTEPSSSSDEGTAW